VVVVVGAGAGGASVVVVTGATGTGVVVDVVVVVGASYPTRCEGSMTWSRRDAGSGPATTELCDECDAADATRGAC
jgi:hypothetical protein